jgi:opacity protein-like surface antigen
MHHPEQDNFNLLNRAVIGALILAAMLLVGVQAARAASNQLIPSIGLTRAVHGDNEVTPYAQVGLRTTWAPAVMTEVGVAYRQDKFNNGDITVKSWPVTASLWLSPFPALYAGGGVGWYQNSVDYSDRVPYDNFTTQKLGLHVGGGFTVPVTPGMGLDLNAKYVFLEKENRNDLSFDASHWTTSAGLAFHF